MSDINEQYKAQIQIISDAVAVEGELEKSVLVNTFRNALAKDKNEAVKQLRFVDLDDHVKLRMIQLRIAMSDYLEDIIIGIDRRHKQAAQTVMDLENGVRYEQE